MNKKWITTGAIILLLGMPISVSASGLWPGHQHILQTEENIDLLDGLLTQQEKEIQDLNQTISKLKEDVLVTKETKEKAEAFDVITKTIRDESGIDIHTGNYQSTLTRLTKLYHNNWFVRTAARTIIEWLF